MFTLSWKAVLAKSAVFLRETVLGTDSHDSENESKKF